MRILLAAACLVFAQWVNAQDDWQKRTDSVTKLIQQYYNAKNVSALYDLGGNKFKATIPQQQFSQITETLHAQVGELKSYQLESTKGQVAFYKAAFGQAVLSMLVGLDSTNKFETFRLLNYEENLPPKAGTIPSDNPLKTDMDRHVDSLVMPYMKKANTVGMAVGLLQNGRTYVYGYGETARDNQLVPNSNTLFEIGSITKTFTATLLAYFVQQGKLQLDDPINKYLPDSIGKLEYNGKPVTIRSLSNHSSGLPRLPSNFAANSNPVNPYINYDDKKLFSFLAHFKPLREPGKEYEYSNLAAGLLGVILERISGKPYETLLQEIIWRPLQMNNTRVTLAAADSSKFALGHGENGNAVHSWEFQSMAGAGAIRSCVNDMLLYAKAQGSNDNSALSKAIQLTHQPSFDYGQTHLGLGWFIFTQKGKKYIAHDGQTGGYSSSIIVDPATGNAVVLLTNAVVQSGNLSFDLIQSLEQK